MVYILLANGFEEIEALTFVDILRRAKIEIETVSVYNNVYVTGSHDITVKCDKIINQVNENDIEAVILPGGVPGTPNLKACNEVKSLLDIAYNNNKYIGAICAAPSILAELGYLNGKNATANPDYLSKLINANALEDKVVTDGNIITSRAAGTAHKFAFKFVELLKGSGLATALEKSMLY